MSILRVTTIHVLAYCGGFAACCLIFMVHRPLVGIAVSTVVGIVNGVVAFPDSETLVSQEGR